MKVDKIDTEKGNIMIATFMGQHITPKALRRNVLEKNSMYIHELKYHSSWDWLMPVVAKIESKTALNRIDILYKNCKIEYSDEDVYYEVETGIQGDTKIESVWTAIVYFIDWVNENKVDLDNPVFYD